MTNRMRASAAALLGVLAISGCDILDVKNPNNLVEEDATGPVAAESYVNGVQALVSESISLSWQPYLVASDDFYWIGSRDGFGQLDQGFVDNPNNEFIDGHFPGLGEARWMADEAVELLTAHVSNDPSNTEMQYDLARANLYAGIIYMVIGEIQEDFAFSDKQESGPPVGPANMFEVLDGAIARLTAAYDGFTALGEDEDARDARALRARAHHSRAVWDVINPAAPAAGGTPIFVTSAAAGADAAAVLADVGNGFAYRYNLTFPTGAPSNQMAGWINDRKENQIDLSLVTTTAADDVSGVAIQDPIDAIADPIFTRNLQQWKGGPGSLGAVTDAGGVRPDLTLVSTEMLHLILAENAMGTPAFTTQINFVRGMYDDLTAYSGQVTEAEILMHTRRVATWNQGLRLADMYRWGLQPQAFSGAPTADWAPASEAVQTPGEMLSFGIVEIRANCYLNGSC